MEKLQEILIPIETLPKLSKVRDLIYFDGPLLSHYQSENGENFLFYWIDSDETNNRWLIFRMSLSNIYKYVEKHISLHDIFTKNDNEIIYKVDIDNDLRYTNLSLVKIQELPLIYLPDPDSYYSFGTLSNLEKISDISRVEKTGILQLYYNSKTSKIGYGTIELNLLANSLTEINNINNGIRKNFITKSKEKFYKENNRATTFDTQLLINSSTFEYIGNTKGSFGALFKIKSNELSFDKFESLNDAYMGLFIEFFESSTNIEKFSNFIKDYDKSIVDNYKKLLKNISKSQIQFNINYENFSSNTHKSKKINPKEALLIINNINSLEFNDSKEIYLRGHFIALNLKTGNYQFDTIETESLKSENSTGHLDEDRKKMAYKINWNKTYDIIVNRIEEKKIGNKKSTIVDTLISFVEL